MCIIQWVNGNPAFAEFVASLTLAVITAAYVILTGKLLANQNRQRVSVSLHLQHEFHSIEEDKGWKPYQIKDADDLQDGQSALRQDMRAIVVVFKNAGTPPLIEVRATIEAQLLNRDRSMQRSASWERIAGTVVQGRATSVFLVSNIGKRPGLRATVKRVEVLGRRVRNLAPSGKRTVCEMNEYAGPQGGSTRPGRNYRE